MRNQTDLTNVIEGLEYLEKIGWKHHFHGGKTDGSLCHTESYHKIFSDTNRYVMVIQRLIRKTKESNLKLKVTTQPTIGWRFSSFFESEKTKQKLHEVYRQVFSTTDYIEALIFLNYNALKAEELQKEMMLLQIYNR